MLRVVVGFVVGPMDANGHRSLKAKMRKLGRSKTEAKTAAARRNGKLGGRPTKAK